jgi:NTP pyrophosphatase (non-canonical NTP hydrolase)
VSSFALCRRSRGAPCRTAYVGVRTVGRWDTAGVQINDLSEEVEAVSAYYAERHSIDRTDDWFVLKLNEEVGELTQAYLARAGQARDKGRTGAELEQDFRAELADVLAQVLLLARRFDVDLSDEVDRKWLVWKPSQ